MSVFLIAKRIETVNRKLTLVKTEYNSRRWSLPGGGIDNGESPEEAIKRESREELKKEIEDLKKIGIFQPRKSDKPVHLFKGKYSGELVDIPTFNDIGEMEISERIEVEVSKENWSWLVENVYRGQVALIAFYFMSLIDDGSIVEDYLSPPYKKDPFEHLGLESPYAKQKA